jgi:hypothetical protein
MLPPTGKEDGFLSFDSFSSRLAILTSREERISSAIPAVI